METIQRPWRSLRSWVLFFSMREHWTALKHHLMEMSCCCCCCCCCCRLSSLSASASVTSLAASASTQCCINCVSQVSITNYTNYFLVTVTCSYSHGEHWVHWWYFNNGTISSTVCDAVHFDTISNWRKTKIAILWNYTNIFFWNWRAKDHFYRASAQQCWSAILI